jgi:pyrimidine oxygenase
MTRAALVGSPETIGNKLAEIIKGAQLDGVTVIVPDFIDDLKVVGTEVLEMLELNGVQTNARAHQKATR